jgi:hypothetical protein
MRTNLFIVAVGVGVILAVVPARAHHAFSAEFDAAKPVTLVGSITKMQWINPHAWLYIDVTAPDGKVETWMIEAGSPNVLLRRGFNKSMLELGTVIKVRGFLAKDGSHKANGGDMTLPNGKTLLLGSSGTGAPDPVDEKGR